MNDSDCISLTKLKFGKWNNNLNGSSDEPTQFVTSKEYGGEGGRYLPRRGPRPQVTNIHYQTLPLPNRGYGNLFECTLKLRKYSVVL